MESICQNFTSNRKAVVHFANKVAEWREKKWFCWQQKSEEHWYA